MPGQVQSYSLPAASASSLPSRFWSPPQQPKVNRAQREKPPSRDFALPGALAAFTIAGTLLSGLRSEGLASPLSSRKRSGRRTWRRLLRGALSPSFELHSVNGQLGKFFNVSKLEVKGELPPDVSMAAVSASGMKKLNQDCVAVHCSADADGDVIIAVVADGHGEHGHHCAARLCSSLPPLLAAAIATIRRPGPVMEDALRMSFLEAEEDLKRHMAEKGLSCEVSGAALAALILRSSDNLAYMATTGDCQVVFLDEQGKAASVSRPHKAHDEEEYSRIVAAGGRVKKSIQGQEVFSRVYTPAGTFGLAMSRSFGDLCVKRHGVTAEPSVVQLQVPAGQSHLTAVLGSDGLFEFIKPEEVAGVVTQRWNLSGPTICAEVLVAEAQKRWQQRERDYCDDVSCLVLRVGESPVSEGATKSRAATVLLD